MRCHGIGTDNRWAMPVTDPPDDNLGKLLQWWRTRGGNWPTMPAPTVRTYDAVFLYLDGQLLSESVGINWRKK